MKKFDKDVLKLKKEAVISAVMRVVQIRKIPPPDINFEGCSEESDELAHYHPDTNIICISERQLGKQNISELEYTAYHEVTHFFEHGHGSKFKSQKEASQLAGFRPPAGVVHIDGGARTKYEKDKPRRINKTTCNHPSCGKRVKLKKCPFCESYYCKEHFKQTEPGPYKPGDYYEKGGHPCWDGYKYKLLNEIVRRGEDDGRYNDALDKILKPKSWQRKQREQKPIIIKGEKRKKGETFDYRKLTSKLVSSPWEPNKKLSNEEKKKFEEEYGEKRIKAEKRLNRMRKIRNMFMYSGFGFIVAASFMWGGTHSGFVLGFGICLVVIALMIEKK